MRFRERKGLSLGCPRLIHSYLTLLAGGVAVFIPIVLFRFRLNVVAFSDAEMRLLGVNADALRMVALVCGSLMILTAQVNAGQVAMVSLVVPFIVRAVFGSEFRKQLVGNVLCGAIVLLAASDVVSLVVLHMIDFNLNLVINVGILPLYVWMIAIGQRSWE